ncbi:hypothetical protein BDB01DRAFT_801182 [Pilobolus umbonatus]|nr:hypothetical protein BDB01DRAFT_801182 [Pilobolus umbonatus]
MNRVLWTYGTTIKHSLYMKWYDNCDYMNVFINFLLHYSSMGVPESITTSTYQSPHNFKCSPYYPIYSQHETCPIIYKH